MCKRRAKSGKPIILSLHFFFLADPIGQMLIENGAKAIFNAFAGGSLRKNRAKGKRINFDSGKCPSFHAVFYFSKWSNGRRVRTCTYARCRPILSSFAHRNPTTSSVFSALALRFTYSPRTVAEARVRIGSIRFGSEEKSEFSIQSLSNR